MGRIGLTAKFRITWTNLVLPKGYRQSLKYNVNKTVCALAITCEVNSTRYCVLHIPTAH